MEEKDIILGAEAVIRVRAKNLCTKQDLLDMRMTIDQMFRMMVNEEGVFGICEDDYAILDITPIQEEG